ncbi:MAG: hypothetical protein U9N04_00265 [Patescibacteria group bacterium]|nr:hypothetical protein [Patescibacteria group bacterium]
MRLKFIGKHKIIIVGGIWGLFSGVLYAWGIFAEGFAGHQFIFPENLRLIFLPAHLTHLITTSLRNSSLILFFIWFAGIPVLFGVTIGAGVEYLINKFKK